MRGLLFIYLDALIIDMNSALGVGPKKKKSETQNVQTWTWSKRSLWLPINVMKSVEN